MVKNIVTAKDLSKFLNNWDREISNLNIEVKKINFIGICCGGEPHHVREMAVALGKKPISYKYYPDMSKHYAHGTDPNLKRLNTDVAKKL